MLQGQRIQVVITVCASRTTSGRRDDSLSFINDAIPSTDFCQLTPSSSILLNTLLIYFKLNFLSLCLADFETTKAECNFCLRVFEYNCSKTICFFVSQLCNNLLSNRVALLVLCCVSLYHKSDLKHPIVPNEGGVISPATTKVDPSDLITIEINLPRSKTYCHWNQRRVVRIIECASIWSFFATACSSIFLSNDILLYFSAK